eukprot:5282450-Pleurochrysis_carterae.AAC.1
MGRATLMTGPHAEQSVGLLQGSSSTAPVMTEQAFTLDMRDLRLDVGHEERSSKELPDYFFEREEAAAESSPSRAEN